MRIEVNIGVTPKDADDRRKSHALHTACRTAADLLHEDFEAFSFITTVYLLVEKCTDDHPARIILTTYVDPFETAARRSTVIYRNQGRDSIFCTLLNDLHGDAATVTTWPDIINMYTMLSEGWEVPNRLLSEILESMTKYQRKASRKKLSQYFAEDSAPVPVEMSYIKLLEGEEMYLHAEDLPSVRKAVLSLGF